METEACKHDQKGSEREFLQSSLLTSVKNCQTAFGGRGLLATELDQSVKALCTSFEQALCHGLKNKIPEKKNSTIRQVTDLVLRNSEQYTLWDAIQDVLTCHERERYEFLKHVWTDRGRARAWLRSSINERSIERYLSALVNSQNLKIYYEDWAFLINQESSSILPVSAAGLSSILFALSIDKPELNQVINQSLNKISHDTEPIIEEFQPTSSRKKTGKKNRRVNPQIISFGDEEVIEAKMEPETVETFLPSPSDLIKQEDLENIGEIECAVEATSITCNGDSSLSDSDNKTEGSDHLIIRTSSGLRLLDSSSFGELTTVKLDEETRSSDDSISVPSYSEEQELMLNTTTDTTFSSDLRGTVNEETTSGTEELLQQIRKYKEMNSVLDTQLTQQVQDHQTEVQQLEIKVTELNRENGLLKHQLRKYVNAVQSLKEEPVEREDESHSEELYQQKLVQVAEMHSELMELNERLLKNAMSKELVIKRLYLELEALRGPLGPSEIDVTSQLISLWVPSVFLTGSPKQHHVYQVHIRVGSEEWNVYRRYSIFLQMHNDLQKQYPIIAAFKFPPKKTIGNKDSKFVDERRVKLQQYLRRLVNHVIANNPELTSTPTRVSLVSVIPFFGEPFDSPDELHQHISYPRPANNAPRYSGL